MSSPRPPFIVSWMPSAARLVALMTSSPPSPLRTSRSLAASAKRMFDLRLQAEHVDPAARRSTTPNTSSPCVALTVTVSAAPSPPPAGPRRSRSTCVTSVPLRSPTTMLSAPPSARKSMLLDVVQVHRDVGDVADEQRAPAVGQDVDVLGDVGAEEQHRVGAGLAFDRVVAVARVPLEDVVAGAEERDVVAVVAEHEVVAVAAEQHVGALAAEDGVVAGAAVDRELDHAGRQRGGGDAVVAAEPVDDQRVVRAFRVGDVDLGREADDRHRACRRRRCRRCRCRWCR